jgi:hypothetical protein
MAASNTGNTFVWIAFGVIGLAVVGVLNRLFRPDETDVSANAFDDPALFPELWASTPLQDAAGSGLISSEQITAIDPLRVRRAVDMFHASRGILNDDEERAVAAWAMLPNYVEVLTASETFTHLHGITPAAYGAEYLGANERARIFNTVRNKRPR